MRVLPAILAMVAGYIDAACFLGLSEVFTAHVTGNFAALASSAVVPSATAVLRIEVVTAFGVGAAFTRLATRRLAAFEPILRRVLLLELAMLALALTGYFALGNLPLERLWVAVSAAAAMGAQSALSKLPHSLPSPTTVMTSNYTQWTICVVDALAAPDAASGRAARAQLAALSALLLAFVPGAFAGAYGEARFGFAALLAPFLVIACSAVAIHGARRWNLRV